MTLGLVRWLVIDTGSCLSGRKVLLPPSVLGHFSAIGDQFSVRLTMQQVKDSPGVDTDLPVSRQMEINTYDYYGWNPYWSSGLYMAGFNWGTGGMSPVPTENRCNEPKRWLPRSRRIMIFICVASKK